MARIAQARGPRSEEELARAALAGEGEAFAELYDRHEQRVYRFCVRLLGNPDDAADATQETFMRLLKRLPALEGRELNALAYVLTAARHACYDIIQGRKRVELSGEEIEPPSREPGAIDEDPERAALLATTRELTQRAHARLAPRQREVLALRELEGLSYEEIGSIMELERNAVAQLISRARIKLTELVRGDALESIVGASPDCERALPLLAREQDGQALASDDDSWLVRHLRDCATCRVRESAMQEAGVSYRALAPIVPLVWLRQATIARAAELVNANWSGLAGAHAGYGGSASGSASRTQGGRTQPSSGAGQSAGDAGQSAGSRGGGHGVGGDGSGNVLDVAAGEQSANPGLALGELLGFDSHRRRLAALAVLVACLLTFGLLVGSIAHDGSASPRTPTLTSAPASALTLDRHPLLEGTQRRGAHRYKTVRPVLPSGRVVSVKTPSTSALIAGTAHPRISPRTGTAHRDSTRRRSHHKPTAAPAPAVTTPATTPAPAATTPTTSTPPTPATTTSTPTTTTPATTPTTTTPTTTNPNTPPTTTTPVGAVPPTNPNSPPGR
jgi:RNA polymerase sigma factor (sigma-70 family)